MKMKSRPLLIAVFLLLISCSPVSAQELSFGLSTSKALVAEPVYLDVSLCAAVPKGEVWVTNEGFLSLQAQGPDGPCKRTFQVQSELAKPPSPWGSATTILLTAEHGTWRKRLIVNEEYVIERPGTYRLLIQWKTPPLDPLGKERALKQLATTARNLRPHFLEGFSKQTEISVEFTCPQGKDAEAYAMMADGPCPKKPFSTVSLIHYDPDKMLNLLKDFPTSTYAAYVIYGRMSGFMQWEPTEDKKNMFAAGIEAGGWFSNSYPDDTGKSKDGSVWLKGQAAADWWAKWYEIILKNHPDIWFADELRLKKAVDQMCLKNYQAAQADLETLSKDPTFKQKDKAQAYLGLMKQKGWIKG